MQALSQAGQGGRQAFDDIVRRHGFSAEAVAGMLESVRRGHGGMAQFSHPEFGGSGQWMRGGMTMVSNLSDPALKARIDALCNDLAALVGSGEPEPMASAGSQSQSQGRGGAGWQAQGAGELEAPQVPVHWWPAELHRPDSTGSQNDMRYAWFAAERRLAIERHGRVTVVDTLDHRIGGFAQQQSGSGSLTLTSQHGRVDVDRLPVVSQSGGDAPNRSAAAAASEPAPRATPSAAAGGQDDVLATIEKLARLHADGVLTEQEFSSKKAELLARL